MLFSTPGYVALNGTDLILNKVQNSVIQDLVIFKQNQGSRSFRKITKNLDREGVSNLAESTRTQNNNDNLAPESTPTQNNNDNLAPELTPSQNNNDNLHQLENKLHQEIITSENRIHNEINNTRYNLHNKMIQNKGRMEDNDFSKNYVWCMIAILSICFACFAFFVFIRIFKIIETRKSNKNKLSRIAHAVPSRHTNINHNKGLYNPRIDSTPGKGNVSPRIKNVPAVGQLKVYPGKFKKTKLMNVVPLITMEPHKSTQKKKVTITGPEDKNIKKKKSMSNLIRHHAVKSRKRTKLVDLYLEHCSTDESRKKLAV